MAVKSPGGWWYIRASWDQELARKGREVARGELPVARIPSSLSVVHLGPDAPELRGAPRGRGRSHTAAGVSPAGGAGGCEKRSQMDDRRDAEKPSASWGFPEELGENRISLVRGRALLLKIRMGRFEAENWFCSFSTYDSQAGIVSDIQRCILG